MKKYKSVRNGQIAELVIENEQQVTIRLEESREERNISPATLKRWWKEIEEPQTEEITSTEEVIAKATDLQQIADENSSGPLQIGEIMEIIEVETNIEAIEEEQTEEVNVIDITDEEPTQIDFTEFGGQDEEQLIQEEPAREVKPEKKEKKAKKPREKISGEHPLKNFLEQLATERQTEVFVATVPSFRSLKVDGRRYMAFTFNKKGVTLWMRSTAVEELTEYKKMNHRFDARVHFAEDTQENKDKIEKLLDASLEFQKNRQTKKSK